MCPIVIPLNFFFKSSVVAINSIFIYSGVVELEKKAIQPSQEGAPARMCWPCQANRRPAARLQGVTFEQAQSKGGSACRWMNDPVFQSRKNTGSPAKARVHCSPEGKTRTEYEQAVHSQDTRAVRPSRTNAMLPPSHRGAAGPEEARVSPTSQCNPLVWHEQHSQ